MANRIGFTDDIRIDIPDGDAIVQAAARAAAEETRRKWDAKTAEGKREGKTPRMRISITARRGVAVAKLTVAAWRLYTLNELETKPDRSVATTGGDRAPIWYRQKSASGSEWVEAPDAFNWDGLILQRRPTGKLRAARASFGPRDELDWYRDDLASDLEARVEELIRSAL